MSVNNPQILFPVSAIKQLKGVRSPAWDGLIERIVQLNPDNQEVIGFVLMMTRQCSCITCNSDSFRMLKGCEECGKQAIRRNKCNDDAFISNHADCVTEIEIKQKENGND